MSWLVLKVASFLIGRGIERIFSWIFRKNSLLIAIYASIDRTCSDFNIESLDYLLRNAFAKDPKLIQLIQENYKTDSEVVIDKMSGSLIDIGADFGEETSSKIAEICKKFIEILEKELLKAENIPISAQQTNAATEMQHNFMSEEMNKISTKQDKILDVISNQNKYGTPLSGNTALLQEEDRELEHCKYKKEIDEAKILLDRKQHKAAMAIYNKLLTDFNSDQNVPALAKFKVHNNLGSCQATLGLTKEAVDNFKIAYDIIGPSSMVACKNRAVASLLEGKPKEGIQYINAAIAMDPSDNSSINIKATLLRKAGEIEALLELYYEKETEDEN